MAIIEQYSLEFIREKFRYDPETGLAEMFVPTKRIWRRPSVVNGYEVFQFRSFGLTVNVTVHRLAFVLMTGAWPCQSVDHFNRVKSDNRWNNLRLLSRRENAFNSAPSDRARHIYPVRLFRGGRWHFLWQLSVRFASGQRQKSSQCIGQLIILRKQWLAERDAERAASLVDHQADRPFAPVKPNNLTAASVRQNPD